MGKTSRAPISYTCSAIDSVIDAIKSVEKSSNLNGHITEEELKTALTDINSTVWNLDTALEDLRKSNAKLRDWGDQEASKVDDLVDEVNSLQDKIKELESRIEEQDGVIKDLEEENVNY